VSRPEPAPTRRPRVDAALARLVADGTLSAVQADAVRVAVAAEPEPDTAEASSAGAPTSPTRRGRPDGPGLAEIAGYAGGALVAAAASLFVAELWQDLTDATRALWLAGTTAVLLAAAGVVAALAGEDAGPLRPRGGGSPAARRRLVATFVALAAGTAGGAAGVAAGGAGGLWAGLAATAVALAGWVAVPSAVGAVSTWAASLVLATGALAAADRDGNDVAAGLVLLAAGVAWVLAALAAEARRGSGREGTPVAPVAGGGSGSGERLLLLALGCGTALVGAQLAGVGSTPVQYGTTAGLAVAGFLAYAGTGAWPFVATGVVAVTLAVPEAVSDWTGGDLGAAGGVLVAGVALLVASALGLRLRRAGPAGSAGPHP
jgi:hypothetical protein